MKPLIPHDPLDDLIAAALHGELTPEERTQFEARLSNDPAAQAAYQEAQAMHDLLEKTHRSAQPDPNFEQRMVSGVRRKLQTEKHRETAFESALALWLGLKRFFTKLRAWEYAVVFIILALLGGVALGPITNGIKKAQQSAEMQQRLQLEITKADAQQQIVGSISGSGANTYSGGTAINGGSLNVTSGKTTSIALPGSDNVVTDSTPVAYAGKTLVTMGGNSVTSGALHATGQIVDANALPAVTASTTPTAPASPDAPAAPSVPSQTTAVESSPFNRNGFADNEKKTGADDDFNIQAVKHSAAKDAIYSTNLGDTGLRSQKALPADAPAGSSLGPTVTTQSGMQKVVETINVFPNPEATTTAPPAIDTRKLIRNAQLDLEVKSFQSAMDQIAALTKSAGGYIDTSSSQKGGNGKLQGTVVVKVLPQNLDTFLLKLRDLGQVQNQSVSTDDVTKDYFDTQARLVNSQRMETQLQDLLKRENGKVSDLLAVERELGRVRGDIEQMQGQLKLYDFQVQYATVTMQLREKDLNQTAAYTLKEMDDFSLFATDVESTYQKARQVADDFKGNVLVANLNHNSGSDVSALLVISVPPDQVESFLAQIKLLGRTDNFKRETQRVAKDGGDSNQPADQTLTEKAPALVNISIRSDDETRKQVALTVVAKAVDDALDQAKTAALANAGVEILSSSLNKTPEGASTAQLSVRVPGKDYSTLITALEALGRTASLSIQRNDNSGPGANGDDAPVIVSLSLTDDDTPLQETALSVLADDVDSQSQQIKKDAGFAGVEVKASSFERQPDGTELAQMTFRLPMSKYPAFLDSVKKLGKVESLTVHRDDRPDQTRTDDTAPVEITLQLHNQRGIVAENDGLFATLRHTFADGAAALFGSVRVIGVVLAFTAPWLFTIGLLAWIGRRIYVWRQNR